MYGFWITKGLVCIFCTILVLGYDCLLAFDLSVMFVCVLSLLLLKCISLVLLDLGMKPGHFFLLAI